MQILDKVLSKQEILNEIRAGKPLRYVPVGLLGKQSESVLWAKKIISSPHERVLMLGHLVVSTDDENNGDSEIPTIKNVQALEDMELLRREDNYIDDYHIIDLVIA